jgi:glutaconate CoA-transferase subunit B
VKRLILFREEHTRRVFVPKVDFISAAGPRHDGTYRTGGPLGLLTNLCWFGFDSEKLRFRLASVHPGHTVEEVRDNTGFAFDCPEQVPSTPAPDAATLTLLRSRIASEIGETYPRFVARVFPDASVAPAARASKYR